MESRRHSLHHKGSVTVSSVSNLDNGAIGFAERVMTVLRQGRFVSTYKYAVLLGLIDLVLEQTTKQGLPPTSVTTRQLAEKLIEIYWPHTSPFANNHEPAVLQQNAGAPGAQAALINLIAAFRTQSNAGPLAPYFTAKYSAPAKYVSLLNKVEWKLIEMPLPKLQRIGNSLRPFIYTIHWDDSVKQGEVSAYQRGEASQFDNRIIFNGNSAEYLVRLNGLLRPLIQQEWSVKVAQLNDMEESRLQNFLFGANRAAAASLCDPLAEIQHGRCFYCDGKLAASANKKPEVDHFIPWARYPDDSISNYVVAHGKCNRDKRDFLAANQHVSNWVGRLSNESLMGDISTLAQQRHWECDAAANLGVASAIYRHLQPEVELWKIGKNFEAVNGEVISRLFVS
jgi:hypothetical protein